MLSTPYKVATQRRGAMGMKATSLESSTSMAFRVHDEWRVAYIARASRIERWHGGGLDSRRLSAIDIVHATHVHKAAGGDGRVAPPARKARRRRRRKSRTSGADLADDWKYDAQTKICFDSRGMWAHYWFR